MPIEFSAWTFEQQRLFFRVYRHMRLNQSAYLPKGAPPIARPVWNVICNSAAGMAAQMSEASPTGDTFAATLQPEE